MSSIKEKIHFFQKQIAPAILLVVTKKRSREEIQAVVNAGIKDIGENTLQEILQKYDADVFRWLQQCGVKLHFIGHLQRNKAAKIARLVDCIQSVDSIALLEKLEQEALKLNKVLPIFFELNLGSDPNKYGFREEEIKQALMKIKACPHIMLRGFMTVGKMNYQEKTRKIFNRCKELATHYHVHELSMGMSNDFQIALEEGSTMVRMGNKIFE